MAYRFRSIARPLIATAFVVTLAVGCASTEAGTRTEETRRTKASSKASGVGAPLPPIVVKRLGNGKKLDLSSHRGKAVLLDIWASWCAPCKEELPLLDDLAARLKPKGIEIIAVSIDEEEANATAFLSARKHWTLTVAHDPEGKVPDLLKPGKMPTSYVLDGTGIVRYVNEGFERSDLEKLERRLLAVAEGDS